MNDNDLSDLARMLPVPDARDFLAGRQQALKEHLMTEFRTAGGHRAGLSPARRAWLRSRILGATAAAVVAVAVAAAAGVSVALPASHPASHLPASHPASEPGTRLAAWTVTQQADGTIHVTFRQVTDPAGLQRTLRADGVPASVTFTGHQNPACRSIPRLRPPRNSSSSGLPRPGPLARVIGRKGAPRPQGQVALVIHPAALPPGEGVQIWTSGTPGAADNFRLQLNLVHASPRCTGS